MKMTKLIAGLAASVVAVSAMAATVSAATFFTQLEPGQAMLGFADNDWKATGWGKGDDGALDMSYFTLANVTADGTYTVAVDLSAGYTAAGWEDEDTGEELVMTTANGVVAMGINLNVEADNEIYDNVMMNITSVKFDGVEAMKDGVTSFTNNEDGGKRSNVLNNWASFDATKADHLSVDPATATTVLTDFSGEWSVCEVTFEVTGMPAAAVDTDAPVAGGDKASPDTGVEGVAAVAGLAAVAAGAVVLSKKRK